MARKWIPLLILLAVPRLRTYTAAGSKSLCTARPRTFHRKQQTLANAMPLLSEASSMQVWTTGRLFIRQQVPLYGGRSKNISVIPASIANFGPYYYIGDGDNKLESYSIDIEFAVVDDSAPSKVTQLVLFERNIPANELPPDFEHLDIGEIVSYDVGSRKAHFKVGSHHYEYQVPAL